MRDIHNNMKNKKENAKEDITGSGVSVVEEAVKGFVCPKCGMTVEYFQFERIESGTITVENGRAVWEDGIDEIDPIDQIKYSFECYNYKIYCPECGLITEDPHEIEDYIQDLEV